MQLENMFLLPTISDKRTVLLNIYNVPTEKNKYYTQIDLIDPLKYSYKKKALYTKYQT